MHLCISRVRLGQGRGPRVELEETLEIQSFPPVLQRGIAIPGRCGAWERGREEGGREEGRKKEGRKGGGGRGEGEGGRGKGGGGSGDSERAGRGRV